MSSYIQPKHLILSDNPTDVKIVMFGNSYDRTTFFNLYLGKKFLCRYRIYDTVHIHSYPCLFDSKCLTILKHLFPDTPIDYSFVSTNPINFPTFDFTADPIIYQFESNYVDLEDEFFDSAESYEQITGKEALSCWFGDCRCQDCESEYSYYNKD